MSGDYRWLELTAVSATDTGSELAALDTFFPETLGAIARSIVSFPPAGDQTQVFPATMKNPGAWLAPGFFI